MAAVSALASRLSQHPSLAWAAPLGYAIATVLTLVTAVLLITFPDIFWIWLPGIMGAFTSLTVVFALIMMRLFPRETQKEENRWPLIIKGLIIIGMIGLPVAVLCDVVNLPLSLFGFGLPVKFVPLLTAGISGLYLAASIGPTPKNLGATSPGSEEYLLDGYELTPRETEVAKLLLHGYSYKEIAERLEIAASTAKSHVLRVYEKTGASNKMELVRFTRNPPGHH
jgi:DNA-binding CsgD family transcriptional regulator